MTRIYHDDNEYIHSESEYKPITLLCGAVATFDQDSGISYCCNTCFATVGSMGMPKSCKELYDMEKVVDKLKVRE